LFVCSFIYHIYLFIVVTETHHEAAAKKFKVDNSSKKTPGSVPVDHVAVQRHPFLAGGNVVIEGKKKKPYKRKNTNE
jgi:hypothetical protein